jgi:hypothetical protein
MADKTLTALAKASAGLLYPSETDAPFEPFVWGEAANTAASVRRLAGLPASARPKPQSLDDFLGDLLDESEFATWKEAVGAILSDVMVYRVGSVRVTYYVIGTDAAGRLAGLKTLAVET